MLYGKKLTAKGVVLAVAAGLVLAGCASTGQGGNNNASSQVPAVCTALAGRIAAPPSRGSASGTRSRRLDGTVRSVAYLRECLSILRTLAAPDAEAALNTPSNIDSVVNSIASAYDQRVRRQGRWLGVAGYTSLISSAGALAAPRSDWASLAAVPLLTTQMEDYDSTRILYSVGSTALGLTRAWYDDLRRLGSGFETARAAGIGEGGAAAATRTESTCHSLQVLRAELAPDSAARADATALVQICIQLEDSRSYLEATQRSVNSLASNTELARSFACDIVFLDRQLFQSDDRLRQSPSAAVGSVLSIVPTLLQGVVDGQKLELQEAGRIQQVIGTLTARMGSQPLRDLVRAPPPLPERVAPLADATAADERHGQRLAEIRRRLMNDLALYRTLHDRADDLRGALQPVVLRYSYDPAKRAVEAIRVSADDAASPALQGC
jgi:hypothetical protein